MNKDDRPNDGENTKSTKDHDSQNDRKAGQSGRSDVVKGQRVPLLIPQPHGGALRPGMRVPGNQHTLHRQADEIRGTLLRQLARVANRLDDWLDQTEIWAGQEGSKPRCEACGSYIPGASKLKLPEMLSIIRELRAVLPTQMEVTGVLANIDLSRLSDDKLARIADGEHPMSVLGSEG